jgi:hypothetical protein
MLSKTHHDIEQIANGICEQALNEAKAHVYPLIRNVTLDRLDLRKEFVSAFKLALERGIAEFLAVSQPGIQAVFKFDESWSESATAWDGSIHLLVKVLRLSNAVKTFGKSLDCRLVHYLRRLGWSRFQSKASILDLQQMTAMELHHRVSYGAMFCAVYSVPVKVWPHLEKGE